MAVQAASGDYTGQTKVNNGGAVFAAGTVDTADSPVSSGLVRSAFSVGTDDDYGARIVINNATADGSTKDNTGIGTARGGQLASGTLAFNPNPANRTASDPQFIIRGVSTTVNGASNTTLQSRGSDYGGIDGRDGIGEMVTTRTIGTGPTINVLAKPSTNINPAFTKGSNAGDSLTFNSASGDSLANSATKSEEQRVGRSYGGGLRFMAGCKNPSSKTYKPRDTYES